MSLRSSLRLMVLPVLASFALLGGTGCFVDAGIDGGGVGVGVDVPVVVDDGASEVDVDADATMQMEPGEGAALFVETTSDGHWSIYTSCDTKVSDSSCNFDILISAVDATSIDNLVGSDLGSADSLTVREDGTIHLVTNTSLGLDGVDFDADPGARIEIDMLLDGVEQPGLVTWVSNGDVLQGAPSNPVDFNPAL